MSYPAELACIVWMSETQRKKTSFLREKPEKLAFLSKTSYPFWLAQVGNGCLLIDGLNSPAHTFQFDEPTQTTFFIEELMKNSTDSQKFIETLKAQAKADKQFTSPTKAAFPSLIVNKEVLAFLQESLKIASQEEARNQATIPADVDAKGATQIAQALANCLRALLAHARGLETALDILKEEAEYHKNAANNEIEQLREKRDEEASALKPIIDKKVRELSQKADRTLAVMQKSADKKATAIDQRRENFLRRLQAAEQRKETVQQRIEASRRSKRTSKTSSGLFALKRYERDIDNLKKEVKNLGEASEILRKTSVDSLKKRREEFDKVIAQEEAKLTQIQIACQAKIVVQQERISSINAQTSAIMTSLQNQIDELKKRSEELKGQVEIDWKLDSEEPVQIQVPVYVIKYTLGETEDRYTFVTPIALSKDGSVLNGLRKMLSLSSEPRLKALMHPANKAFHEAIGTQLQERLLSDADFRIRLNALCRANNIADQNSFAQTLNEGLDEIEKRGYMTPEEASDLCKRVTEETA